jgi:uncharacterized protein YndB with AHSA1/START domain
MNSQRGVVVETGDAGTVRFVRRYALEPAELWPYLTEAEHLSEWITPGVEFEARVGGRVVFPWQRSAPMAGRVTVCDAPRVLEYTWTESGAESRVRMELTADGGGTLLVVEHYNLPLKEATGFAAGWHTHLDWMEYAIAGRGREFDEPGRFRKLAEEYGYSTGVAAES